MSKLVMNVLVNKINEDIRKAAEYAVKNKIDIDLYNIESLEDWVPSQEWESSGCMDDDFEWVSSGLDC